MLTAATAIVVTQSPSLREAFPAEVVKLSPPKLETLELRGAAKLTRFVLSPVTACPSLTNLDLNACPELGFVLIQSNTIETLNLSRCTGLKKALIQCKILRNLNMEQCDSLETVMIWSEQLMDLDLSTCTELQQVELYCPELYPANTQLPTLKDPPKVSGPVHPPIQSMLKADYDERAKVLEEEKEAERLLSSTASSMPLIHHKV